jgi:hypothetical protein
MVKSGIGGFPNPCTLQICKRFPTKIIIFEDQTSFMRLIDMKTVFLGDFLTQSGENIFNSYPTI